MKTPLKVHNIQYSVILSAEARELLLKARYPRNIRQFRDIINYSIDAAAPLIADIKDQDNITTYVRVDNIPFDILHDDSKDALDSSSDQKNEMTTTIKNYIYQLNLDGLGPRRISNVLKEKGYNIEYYQIAYYLNKLKSANENPKSHE